MDFSYGDKFQKIDKNFEELRIRIKNLYIEMEEMTDHCILIYHNKYISEKEEKYQFDRHSTCDFCVKNFMENEGQNIVQKHYYINNIYRYVEASVKLQYYKNLRNQFMRKIDYYKLINGDSTNFWAPIEESEKILKSLEISIEF